MVIVLLTGERSSVAPFMWMEVLKWAKNASCEYWVLPHVVQKNVSRLVRAFACACSCATNARLDFKDFLQIMQMN